MSNALILGISLIANPADITVLPGFNENYLKHEITVVIPAYNEEFSIGSKVLLAASYADRVLVIDNGSTDRTAEVATLAGARVIHLVKGGEVSLKSIIETSKDSEFVVFIYSECLQNLDLLSNALKPLKNGQSDITVGSWPGRMPYDLENVVLLNGKRPVNEKIGLMAFSPATLQNLNLNFENLSLKTLVSTADTNGVRVKYLTFNDDPSFQKFDNYKIGVVVPAYNEELLIEETIKGIPEYVDRIYLIDDCSTDRTPEIIKKLSDPRIVSMRHEVNKGVGCSIIDGYKMSLKERMDIVAVMAGDNQMDPAELPRLLIPIIEGEADYTKGNRLLSTGFRVGMSKWRSFGNSLLSLITKIGSGYWQIMDPQNGYTAISKKALEALDLDAIYPYYGYCNDMLIKLNAFGMRTRDVVMPARYGRERSSIKYSRYILKVSPMLFKGFLWRLKVKYTVLDFNPLVFFYYAGMILLPLSVVFGIGLALEGVLSNSLPGYYLLLDLILGLAGIQMLLLGMFFDMQDDKKMRN